MQLLRISKEQWLTCLYTQIGWIFKQQNWANVRLKKISTYSIVIQPLIYSCLMNQAYYFQPILIMDRQHPDGDNVTNKSDYSNLYNGKKRKRGFLNQSQPNEEAEKRSQEQHSLQQAKLNEMDTKSSSGPINSLTYDDFQEQKEDQNENDYAPMNLPPRHVVHQIQTHFTGSTKEEPATMTHSIFFKSSK